MARSRDYLILNVIVDFPVSINCFDLENLKYPLCIVIYVHAISEISPFLQEMQFVGKKLQLQWLNRLYFCSFLKGLVFSVTRIAVVPLIFNCSSPTLQLQFFCCWMDYQRHWYVCRDEKTAIAVHILFNCSFSPTHIPVPHI